MARKNTAVSTAAAAVNGSKYAEQVALAEADRATAQATLVNGKGKASGKASKAPQAEQVMADVAKRIAARQASTASTALKSGGKAVPLAKASNPDLAVIVAILAKAKGKPVGIGKVVPHMVTGSKNTVHVRWAVRTRLAKRGYAITVVGRGQDTTLQLVGQPS